ncbi:hypothetical protein PIB30_035580 [Stylosanthes scabra]|uniref:CCT domain-containing protein n=1 Tax=Stylosanthes scabra TaxID=79078 RepID=A0ABU6VBY8_9FABA|nr:hypothetical protein [Stylosanthes scabra]
MYSDMHGFDLFSHMFKEEIIPDLLFTDDDPFPLFTPQENIIDSSLDPFSLSSFSFSPPCTHFSALDASESQVSVADHCSYNHSYLQRSSSCKLFDRKPSCEVVHHSDTWMDSPSFEWENDFFRGQIRRVFSAGDLKNMTQRDEANLKVGRYSAQERKEKISKYRAKRSQRKFNKTIKYACRKTLADNRVRIRGRFARNDDTSVITKAPCSSYSNTQQDQDEFWIGMIEALNE